MADIASTLIDHADSCPCNGDYMCRGCDDRQTAAAHITRLHDIGDALAEQVMQLLGPLSTDADTATIERHQAVRDGALRLWAEVRRG